MDFTNFIKPALLVLIPVLFITGKGIKKSPIPDKFIPLILGAFSILLSGVYVFASEPISGSRAILTAIFTAFTQGILCAGASVYANELIKQNKKKDEEKENGKI